MQNYRRSGPRILLAVALCLIGSSLATLSFAPTRPTSRAGPMLAFLKTDLSKKPKSGPIQLARKVTGPPTATTSLITFGHPIISGIGGFGYEENLRPHPAHPTPPFPS